MKKKGPTMIAPDKDDEKVKSAMLQQMVEERTRILQQRIEELKKSEERYCKMIEEVQDYAIILLDKDGIIRNWNLGAEKIKQYTEAEAVGKHFRMFYLPEDNKRKLPARLIEEATRNGRAQYEGWRMRKDKTMFWGSITLTALHDAQNKLIGFSKVTRDLTERKLSEDKIHEHLLELESRNRELEQFAFVASHDLQEPIRKILIFIDLIEGNLHDEAMSRKYFKKITSSAMRMSELIKSLLNYSRLSAEGTQLVPTDLNTVLADILSDFEILIAEKKATIKSEPLPVIQAIPLQMLQLFANLISNALKFTNSEPVIGISSRIVSQADMVNRPEYLVGGGYLELSFADNGIGFDQQYETIIFSMFQRLYRNEKFSGTGIGLALCKKIMENHGGYITAMAEPGKGATFYAYFPQTMLSTGHRMDPGT